MARFIVVLMVAALLTSALVRAAVSPKNNPVDSYPTELGETECSGFREFRKTLVGDLVNSRGQKSHEPIRAYFTKYLKDCGLDDRFKNALSYAPNKNKYGDEYGLIDYLERDFWHGLEREKKNRVDYTVRALLFVDNFLTPSELEEPHCQSMNNLYEMKKDTSKEKYYLLLYECFRNSFDRLNEACQNKINRMFKEFEDAGKWDQLKTFRLRMNPGGAASSETVKKRISEMVENESVTDNDLKQACSDYHETFNTEEFSIEGYHTRGDNLQLEILSYCSYLLAAYEKKDQARKAVE